MAHGLRFVIPRPGMVGWELGYVGPRGQLHARGVANEAKLRAIVARLMRRHGARQMTALMGCDCNHTAVNREIRDAASKKAFENLAGMLGISPFKLLKTAAQFHPLNPFNPLSPQMLALRALKAGGKGIASLTRRGGGGGGSQSQDSQNPEDSQNPDDSQSQDAQQDSQQEDTTMGDFDIAGRHRRHHHHSRGVDYDIGCALDGLDEVTRTAITFAPGGAQALQAVRLAKLAQSNNAKVANAASFLNKAKRGDPSTLKKFGFLRGRAKQGDPQAKDAIKRLQKVNRVTSVTVPTGGGHLSNLYRAGIQ